MPKASMYQLCPSVCRIVDTVLSSRSPINVNQENIALTSLKIFSVNYRKS